MYQLNRIQKIRNISIALCVILAILSAVLFWTGNVTAILSLGLSIVFLFLYLIINAIQKDVSECLKFLYENKQDRNV